MDRIFCPKSLKQTEKPQWAAPFLSDLGGRVGKEQAGHLIRLLLASLAKPFNPETGAGIFLCRERF